MNRINEIQERLNEIATDMNDLFDNLNELSKEFYNEYDICAPYWSDALNEHIYFLCDDQDSDQRRWIAECRQSTEYIDVALRELKPNDLNSYTLIKHAQYLYYSDLLYKDYNKLEELRNLHIERGELEQELQDLEQEQVA